MRSVRFVRRLRLAGLCLAILLLSAQAGSARVEGKTAKRTTHPIWTLAIDGSRVAYSSGGLIHVWNLATGEASKSTPSTPGRTALSARAGSCSYRPRSSTRCPV